MGCGLRRFKDPVLTTNRGRDRSKSAFALRRKAKIESKKDKIEVFSAIAESWPSKTGLLFLAENQLGGIAESYPKL